MKLLSLYWNCYYGVVFRFSLPSTGGSTESRATNSASAGEFVEASNFDKSKLTVTRIDRDGFIVSYKNDTRLFIESGEYLWTLRTYKGKYSRSVLVKISQTMLAMKNAVSELVGQPVYFSTNAEAESIALFTESVTNTANEKCLNVLDHGTPKLIPLGELNQHTGAFKAILKAGKIITQNNALVWRFSIVEGKISQPLPGSELQFTIAREPTLKFFKQQILFLLRSAIFIKIWYIYICIINYYSLLYIIYSSEV